MSNWRKGLHPILPRNIFQLAEWLQSGVWTEELKFKLSFANVQNENIEETTHEIEAFGVQIRRGQRPNHSGEVEIEVHIVMGCPLFAANFTNVQYAFVDCTFDAVPNIKGANQFFTLMVEYDGQYFPIAFSVMGKKTEEAYTAVLECIVLKLTPFLRPKMVMADFETPLQKAIAKVFPEANTKGCWFHHNQAIVRRCQRTSCFSKIKSRFPQHLEEAYRFQRHLMNLSLLPPPFIEEAFEMLSMDLAKNSDLAGIFEDLCAYYKRFWILTKGPASFSVYRNTIRTNNPLERWNRTLKSAASLKPEIGKFIVALKRLVQSSYLDFLTLKQGNNPHRKRCAATKNKDALLEKAWERLGELSLCNKEERVRRYRVFLEEVADQTVGGECDSDSRQNMQQDTDRMIEPVNEY
ncbi:uncharacterized protein [Venturia canescens]|uniref:uncharacterized protein n=1 Tax=Venturia canescens TaxID=32260 RepID=UPI001C9D2E95|nr:uncharacterized protein LOC122413201 [Venturia canescens]